MIASITRYSICNHPLGQYSIGISRPVKSLLPLSCVKNAQNKSIIFPLFALLQSKIQIYRVLCSFVREIFRSDKMKNLGNTWCITEIFCEVWAEKIRSKPTYPYVVLPYEGVKCNRLPFILYLTCRIIAYIFSLSTIQ